MRINLRSILQTILALGLLSSVCVAQSTTIRIRVVDGRTGKPLKLNSLTLTGNGMSEAGYEAKWAMRTNDQGFAEVTLRTSTSFTVTDDEYSRQRCDAAKQKAPLISYKLSEILDRGVVSPNFCGNIQAQPVKGELLIYMRSSHWWETTRDVTAAIPGGLTR